MKITWLGHSCFRIETGQSVILIDPFLKGNPSFEASDVAWEDATRGVASESKNARVTVLPGAGRAGVVGTCATSGVPATSVSVVAARRERIIVPPARRRRGFASGLRAAPSGRSRSTTRG